MTTREDPELVRARARVGQTLRGKWRLERLIGLGGMAAVYAAVHRNGLRGAVKMLHLPLSLAGDIRERFLREGYAANRVEHPGVVRVLDDDVAEDGAIFLVMELLEGQTVEARAQASPGGVLPPAEVLQIAEATLDVLAAAHDKGIVHRDIKPENLFFTTRGQLKVLDFGIARLRELGSVRATTTGAAMGTPAFMPPEQASGRWNLVDGRTDLWALGATMFSLVTGRAVHEEETVQLLLAAAMKSPAPPLSSVMPSAPRGVAVVIDGALAFDMGNRWPSARAMQEAVRHARAEPGAQLSPPSRSAPSIASHRVATARSAPEDLAAPTSFGPAVSQPSHGTTSPVSTVATTKAGRSTAALLIVGALAGLVAGALLLMRLASSAPTAGTAAISASPDPLQAPAPVASSTPQVAAAPPSATAPAPASASASEASPIPTRASQIPPRAAPVRRGKPAASAPPPSRHEGIL